MNHPDHTENTLSTQRLVQPSPGLRERVLCAAHDAWEDDAPPDVEIAWPQRGSERSTWWQFAAAAVVLLLTGLNAVQSAGNLEAAQRSKPLQTTRMTDSEARCLADDLGLTPRDVKRMACLSSRAQ